MSKPKAPVADAASTKGPVGYKRPPSGSRFRPGHSGNPKGRPKRRTGAGDLLRRLFDKKIEVRDGAEVRAMPAIEAVIRRAVVAARNGDRRALATIEHLRDQMEIAIEVTDEERQRRTQRLPRSLTREEFDLIKSPAREKDRHRYLAVGEDNEGDRLAAQRDVAGALAFYRHALDSCKERLGQDPRNLQLQEELVSSVARFGLLADQLLYAGDFKNALRCTDEVIAEAPLPIACENDGLLEPDDPQLQWIYLIRAHAQMFTGQETEAREFYRRLRGHERVELTSWETVVLQDFARLQNAGHAHPLMSEIERQFTEAGWSATPGAPIMKEILSARQLSPDERQHMLLHPEHLQTAELSIQQGKLDEAAEIYRRIMATCKSKLARGAHDKAARRDLAQAVTGLGTVAHQFMRQGRFPVALECAEEVVGAAPEQLPVHAIRATALIFIGQASEALEIVSQHRGKAFGGKSWEALVLEAFAEQRTAGRIRPLMSDIEEQLGRPAATATPAVLATRVTGPLADDLVSGLRLAQQGDFEEAVEVFGRLIAVCQKNIASERAVSRYGDEQNRAVSELCTLAMHFLSADEFDMAEKAAAYVLSAMPQHVEANICRAHAMLLRNRADEARVLYRQYRDHKADAERVGRHLIVDHFAKLRAAGRSHHLMDEIEREA